MMQQSSSPLHSTTKLGWALLAADAGLRVHPLRANTKIAIIKDWPTLATTDIETIKKWWTTYPNANIGIATGNGGPVVVDVDGEEGAANEEKLELPWTHCVRTPHGHHLYFKTDQPVRNSAKKLAPGIDVRGDGGYVVGAGSVIDGVEYTSDDNLPWAAVDASLLTPASNGSAPPAEAPPSGEPIPVGKQNDTLFRMACRWRQRGWNYEGILAGLQEVPLEPCPTREPWTLADFEGLARRACEFEPGEVPVEFLHNPASRPLGDKSAPKPSSIRLVAATTVKPERVDWAYEGRIPLGMITLLVGQGEAGKSLLTHRLAAGYSRGKVPGRFFGTPVHVAIASAEDSRASVIVPRLLAAGADLDYIHFIEELDSEGEPDDIALDGQVAVLEATLKAASVRVLIADTVVAHIPTAHDTYKEQHVRRVLKPLAHMAERLDLAVIGVMHLNRRETRDILTRISGSGGFGNLARSVLLFARDPDDEEGSVVRYLSHPKCNVGPHAPTLRMHIEGAVVKADGVSIITAVVVDEGESDITAAHLLGGANEDDGGAIGEAEDFLRQELADGPVACDAVRKTAGRVGITAITLRRALHRMGIKGHRVGMIGEYTWGLPRVPDLLVQFDHSLSNDDQSLVDPTTR